MQEPSILDECELDEEIKKCLLENIKQKLTQQAVKIRADIEVRPRQNVSMINLSISQRSASKVQEGV